jgi:hypothetical protein
VEHVERIPHGEPVVQLETGQVAVTVEERGVGALVVTVLEDIENLRTRAVVAAKVFVYIGA